MSTKTKLFSASLILAAGLMTAGIAQAQTAQHSDPQPQDNRCWGEAASALAKLGKDDGISGGGMGSHSRSATAADKNGGFRSNDTFAPGDGQPRAGVGNVTRDPNGPHHTDPGTGGLGVHAVNNADFFSTIANPVTGEFESGPKLLDLDGDPGCSTGLTTPLAPNG
jgi:hypothetical protein